MVKVYPREHPSEEHRAAAIVRGHVRRRDASKSWNSPCSDANAKSMAERVLFLTGHLARARLEKVLAETGDLPFAWSVINISVAGSRS